jgi:hypothetical protein
MRSHKCKRENTCPRDDPDNPFHATNILFHDTNLLRFFFGRPAFTPCPLLNVQYQRRERMYVTLSQRGRGTTDDRSLRSLGRWTKMLLRPSSFVYRPSCIIISEV